MAACYNLHLSGKIAKIVSFFKVFLTPLNPQLVHHYCLYCSFVIVFNLQTGSRRARRKEFGSFFSSLPGACSQPTMFCASLLRETFENSCKFCLMV